MSVGPQLVRLLLSDFCYRTSVEYSVPALTSSGRYYWTNCYYWESDFVNPASDASYNRVNLACLNAASEAVTRERWRVESWAGTGTYYGEVIAPVPCHIPGADRCLVTNAVRVASGSVKSQRWWKLLRGLLAPADVIGGRVSDDIISWLTDNYVARLELVPVVNYQRVPVSGYTIRPDVRGWQMRRGTKRSARVVLR